MRRDTAPSCRKSVEVKAADAGQRQRVTGLFERELVCLLGWIGAEATRSIVSRGHVDSRNPLVHEA